MKMFFTSKREAVLSQPVLALSVIPRNQDCAEAVQKYPVVHYFSVGDSGFLNTDGKELQS